MKIKAISLLAFIGSVSTSFATVYVYDGFSGYTTDVSVVGQGPTSTGFSGDWTNRGGALAATVNFNPRETGLSYTNYGPSSAGSLEAFRSSGSHTGGAKQVGRNLSYTADTEDFYISFLIANNSTSAVSNTIVRLQGLGSANADRDSLFQINHSTNTLQFSLGGGVGLTGSASLQAGANLVVVRAIYDFDSPTAGNPNAAFYDQVEVWINPTLSAGGNPTVDTLGAPLASGFGIMRSFNGSGNALPFNSLNFQHSLNSGSVVLDEFMIAAIPEPQTYAALFGLAALAMVLYRRRAR
ncbi:MAG: hypothetical protein JJT96_09945 [Opitutales bacterium]|nr:hypothetical protein [Opitutales bacterium]